MKKSKPPLNKSNNAQSITQEDNKMSDKIDRYENMDFIVEGGYLTLRICIDETKVDVQPSKSGKTLVLSTTGGAVKVPRTPLRLNMTLYRKP